MAVRGEAKSVSAQAVALQEFGLPGADADTLTRTYVTEDIDPYELYEAAVDRFIRFARSTVTGSKIEHVETAADYFWAPDRVDVAAVEELLQPQTWETHEERRVTMPLSDRDWVRDAVVDELVLTMEGQVLSPDMPDWYESVLATESAFLKNYHPHRFYDDLGPGPGYEVAVEPDPDAVSAAAERSNPVGEEGMGSCFWDSPDVFASYEDDPFTIFLTAAQQGQEPRAYSRAFVLEDAYDNRFLGVDTMEVPYADFDGHGQLTRSLTLGMMQLGNDLGVDYVMGGTRKWTKKYTSQSLRGPHSLRFRHCYRKPGEEPAFSFGFPLNDDQCEASAYLLLETDAAVNQQY